MHHSPFEVLYVLQVLPLLVQSLLTLILLPLLLARKIRKWSRLTLAVRSEVDETTIKRIELGKIKWPHLRVIRNISAALGKSPQDLGLGDAYEYRLKNAKRKRSEK